MAVEQMACPAECRRTRVALGTTSTPALAIGLAELAEILSMQPPAGMPPGARRLALRLRTDDALAQQVWGHPMFGALVSWLRDRHPDDNVAWEDMAVYALSRAGLCQASMLTAANIRAGMLATAAWVKYRGRQLERLDRAEPSIESVDVIDEPMLPVVGEEEPLKLPSPLEYLMAVLGRDLPGRAGDVVDEAWKIGHDHYVWLAGLTGFRGEELLAAGQSRVDVNPHRRLARRLPRDWPSATRKAVVHLLAGTPRDAGLLWWWATTPGEAVPESVRSQWRGLVAIIDPTVGRMAELDRRVLRERARRWQPTVGPDCHHGIAV